RGPAGGSPSSGVARLAGQQAEIDAQAVCGGVQALLGLQLEENLVIGGAAEPGVVHQLALQLPGVPAGVAEGNEGFPGPAAAGHVHQDVAGGGQLQRPEVQAAFPVTGPAMQDEPSFALDRTAVEYHAGAYARGN